MHLSQQMQQNPQQQEQLQQRQQPRQTDSNNTSSNSSRGQMTRLVRGQLQCHLGVLARIPFSARYGMFSSVS